METNEQEVLDLESETETTENTELELETEAEAEVDVEALRKENATLKAQKDHWRNKANKAEIPKETQGTGLSHLDVIYMAKADIHDEDVKDVLKYAEKMGVGVKEAHTFLKPIFAERNEERKTASLTQTKGKAGGNSKITPEALLEQAGKGKLPEADDDIEKLALARRQLERTRLGK